MSNLISRMQRAAKLDASVYEEVEHDASRNTEALGIVVLSALAAGIGGGAGSAGGLVGLTLASLVGWVLWAAVIYVVGGKLMATEKTEVTMGQLLRTLGFAQSPGVLRILGILPIVGALVHLAVAIWLLCTMVVAVRSALDYDSNGRAIAVVVLGFLAYVLVMAAVASVLGINPAR